MLLDLSRLRSGVETLTRRYKPSAFDLEHEEFRLAAPVDLVGEVRRDAQKTRLTGRVTTTLECECGRCLESFTVPVDAPLDVLLLPFSENTGAAEQEVTADDLGVSYLKDNIVDLGELMREQFYLAMPMKPLCREDCKGLCPVCGINRNRETCTCEATWVDPRMDALRKFKT
ncbi:MAG: YceD family protein [Vicinamibacterales bacterium]